MTVRALRNSNPGNLEAGPHWQGLMPLNKMSQEQRAEHRFAVFLSPVWGFRALAMLLLNYQDIYRLRTVRAWIARFAPTTENDTAAYVKDVCARMGVGPDDDIDLRATRMLPLACKAISTHECGGWLFLDSDLNNGVALAEQTITPLTS